MSSTRGLAAACRAPGRLRAVFFGFTYALGGGKARPEQFDFGGGAVGG
ncbi:hypothetical protein [Caulobacter sp. LjRoot300]